MFLQFPEPVLGRTRSTRKDSIRVTESFRLGMKQLPGHATAQPEEFRPQLRFVQNQPVQTVGRAEHSPNVFQTVDS